MSGDCITLDIRGMTPRPFSTNGEGQWRKYIADYIAQKIENEAIPHSHLFVRDTDHFEVSMVFHIPRNVLQGSNPPDLDNLSKPVLDTLFCDRYSRRHIKGTLYKIDDHLVWKLSLEKRAVDSQQEAGMSLRIAILPM